MMAAWLAGGAGAWAAEPATTPDTNSDATVVLDGNSLWRHFAVSRCAFARTPDGKLEPWDLTPLRKAPAWIGVKSKPAISTDSSPLPPTDWVGVEMDDSAWPRVRLPQPQPVAGNFGGGGRRSGTRYGATAVVCLRGKFEVKDPSQAKACRLGMDYLGGVVVYLNGKEVVRRHMTGDNTDFLALAEEYPTNVFLTPKGQFASPTEKDTDRGLSDFEIPAALLRRGVNVLAIEIHTAPLPLAYVKAGGPMTPNTVLPWMSVGLLRARLTVSPGAAVVPNASRPAGIQVWNSPPYETLSVFDYGDPCDSVRPLAIHSPRNNAVSGRLVASSDKPLKGLTVKVSDLVQAGGAKLPASAVQVRYAIAVVPGELPTTEHAKAALKFLDRNLSDELSQGKSHLPVGRFDGLLDTIPAEIPVSRAPVIPEDYYGRKVDRTSLTGGAVAPLWFTVRVPKDAKAGAYQGQITISAEGLTAVSVPLRVNVSDWVVPAPQEFRLSHTPVHSDYPVAWHYEVPVWSDKHFEMIGKAHALMAEAGSRQFHLSLIATYVDRSIPASIKNGCDSGLIRWIKQPDGKYKHDLTAFDKYLDMAATAGGTPRPLRLQAWQYSRAGSPGTASPVRPPPDVSVFDPQTGKIERMQAPKPGTDEAVAFWQPAFNDILKRLKDRGWQDATVFAWVAVYGGPDEATAKLAENLWPQATWFVCNHEVDRDWRDGNNHWVKLRYGNTAYNYREPSVRGYRALLDPRTVFMTDICRQIVRDWTPLIHQRRTAEDMAMSGMDGVGDFGIDLFMYCSPDRSIVRSNAGDSPSGPGQSQYSLLYPGPDGPVATERYEMFREGLVLTEALLFVERAIQAKKLSPALHERADKALEARSRAFLMDWFAIRDMPAAEDAKLLDLAGEVAREVGREKK